jgi:hypothetical protein
MSFNVNNTSNENNHLDQFNNIYNKTQKMKNRVEKVLQSKSPTRLAIFPIN